MIAQEMVDRAVSVRQVAAQLGVDESTLRPAVSDVHGVAELTAIEVEVKKPGFGTYRGVYVTPNLGGKFPVSLRRA